MALTYSVISCLLSIFKITLHPHLFAFMIVLLSVLCGVFKYSIRYHISSYRLIEKCSTLFNNKPKNRKYKCIKQTQTRTKIKKNQTKNCTVQMEQAFKNNIFIVYFFFSIVMADCFFFAVQESKPKYCGRAQCSSTNTAMAQHLIRSEALPTQLNRREKYESHRPKTWLKEEGTKKTVAKRTRFYCVYCCRGCVCEMKHFQSKTQTDVK